MAVLSGVAAPGKFCYMLEEILANERVRERRRVCFIEIVVGAPERGTFPCGRGTDERFFPDQTESSASGGHRSRGRDFRPAGHDNSG